MIGVNLFSFGLLFAAAGIGIIHTVLGPDHYLPFVMLARARRWSRARTLMVTLACGIGHVASSLALGAFGLAIGAGVGWVDRIEAHRGNLAAWGLTGIGLAYMLWGVRAALRQRRGLAPHAHGSHVHIHAGGHDRHAHADPSQGGATQFWTLFIVFVLGPCEPLIPLFVLPASRGQWHLAALTGIVFGVCTITCMLGLVLLGHAGLSRVPLGRFERWSHAMAGAVIAASGLAVIYLGL